MSLIQFIVLHFIRCPQKKWLKILQSLSNFVNVENIQYLKKPNPFKETSALSHTYHFRTDIQSHDQAGSHRTTFHGGTTMYALLQKNVVQCILHRNELLPLVDNIRHVHWKVTKKIFFSSSCGDNLEYVIPLLNLFSYLLFLIIILYQVKHTLFV